MNARSVTAAGLLLALVACTDAATAPEIPTRTLAEPAASANFVGAGVAEPIAQRIDAITSAVLAANNQVSRTIVAYPPNPCTEISPACDAAFATNVGYAALGQNVAAVCAGGSPTAVAAPPGGAGSPASGEMAVAGHLTAVASILSASSDRFLNIFTPNPGPPDVPWVPSPGPPEAPVAAALNALSQAVFAGGSAMAGWLGGAFAWPPNPCAVP